ncbi:MAG: cytochrome C peroxidase [Planctomycetia bacterium]|nr:cytochrome C peroxidase [Planctomycetia bacterium]
MFSFGIKKTCIFGLGVMGAGLSIYLLNVDEKAIAAAPDKPDFEFALPNKSWMKSDAEQVPIVFLNRSQNAAEWDKLTSFWNEGTQTVADVITGKKSEMAVVKIKVPLGLTQNPPVPVENSMTVAKWNLGKKIYFDTIISSNNTVSCASCHNPKMGFTDQSMVSIGINGKLGGMSAPSVYNSAYNLAQFWDGRAPTLEAQSQGPPQNPSEMFDGKGNAWDAAVERLRAKPEYVAMFKDVFGTLPTRDGAAKAMAAYERTVLTGNSIHDRTEVAMRKRVGEEETGKFEVLAKDYEKVLSEAIAANRILFNGKARCNGCHVGDSFSDSQFHNLGVGAKDGKLPEGMLGRFGAQPTGQKNPELVGAFKTPHLRQLLATAPYMHDGSLKTLEEVVDFYEKGGNANPFLDVRMRDYASEKASGPKAIKPLALGLTPFEKKDLVNFMKALNGEVAEAIVVDPSKFAK